MNHIIIKLQLIILIIISSGCEDNVQESEVDPASYAIDGMAYYQPEDNTFDIIGLHESGAVIAINQYGNGGEVTYIAEEGAGGFQIWADASGLPTQAYINGNFILFDNYTDSTVDVAIIRSNGQIEILRELQVDDYLSRTWDDSLNRLVSTSDWLRWGGHALSAAGCIASVAGAVSTGGALGPLAWLGCGATVAGILLEFAPEDSELLASSATAIGSFAGAAGCINMAQGNIFEYTSCWAFISSTAMTFATFAFQEEEEIEDDLSLAEGSLESGFGDIQITLTWDTSADLDLWVTDPYGERIYFAHPYSGSGGWLDVDDTNGYGPENIFWPSNGAPSGSYIVQVDHWGGASPSNYSVLVLAFEQIAVYSGTINSNETHDVVTFNSSGNLPRINNPVVLHGPNEGQTK